MTPGDIASAGFLLALFSVPLALGWVPRNRIYGFRIAATLKDDRIWYITNRRMGYEGIIGGLAVWLLGEVLGRMASAPSETSYVGTALVIAGIVIFIIRGWRVARRTAPSPLPPLESGRS